jgi:hypothetical protein
MSPNKAIIIVLILFLIVALGFVFLYLNKQATVQESLLNSMLPSKSQSSALEPGSDSNIQAQLKQLDRLRSQSNPGTKNQALTQADTLQSLDKLRQSASTTAPSTQNLQTELQKLDKLRAQSQTPAP